MFHIGKKQTLNWKRLTIANNLAVYIVYYTSWIRKVWNMTLFSLLYSQCYYLKRYSWIIQLELLTIIQLATAASLPYKYCSLSACIVVHQSNESNILTHFYLLVLELILTVAWKTTSWIACQKNLNAILMYTSGQNTWFILQYKIVISW